MPERRGGAVPPDSPPHRPFFLLGLLMLGLSSLWWCLALLARRRGWPLPWAVSPGLAHGLLFGLGAMPLFITGFVFTAGPRWLRVPGPSAQALRMPLRLTALAWALVFPGLHFNAALAGLGLLLVMLAWASSWRCAGRMLAASAVLDRLHLRSIHAAWLLGLCGLAVMGVGLMTGHEDWARRALQLVLWWCLLPVFLIALHRMVPMFAEPGAWLQGAGRLPVPERALLGTALAGCAWLGCWQMAGAWEALARLPGWVWALRALLESAVACLLLSRAWHWRRMARLPLMAMMLCGGLWLAVGAGLSAWSSALLALGRPGLGLAPVHALLAGGLGSLMMAQVSRVVSTHAGRPLAVDRPLLGLFALMQAAVLMRLWAALERPDPALALLVAGLLWALAMTGWGLLLLGFWRRPSAV